MCPDQIFLVSQYNFKDLRFGLRCFARLACVLSLVTAPLQAGVAQNPHSRGIGKKVTGIVVCSVGSVIGAATMVSGGLEQSVNSNCNDQYYSDSEQQACKKNNSEGGTKIVVGGVVTVASIIGGIALTMSGVHDNRRWQNWEDKHQPKAKAANDDDDSAASFALSPWVGPKSVGLSFTMSH